MGQDLKIEKSNSFRIVLIVAFSSAAKQRIEKTLHVVFSHDNLQFCPSVNFREEGHFAIFSRAHFVLLYQVSQQVLDAKKFHEKKENSSKFVDFRAKREDLNSIWRIFEKNDVKILISRRFEIFTKTCWDNLY